MHQQSRPYILKAVLKSLKVFSSVLLGLWYHCDFSSCSVTSILSQLKWYCLDVRRQVSRLIDTATRGLNKSYKIPFLRIDIISTSSVFPPAIVRLLNSLPDLVINMDSPEAFCKFDSEFLSKL